MSDHWLLRAARAGGLSIDGLSIPGSTEIRDAWRAVSDTCGVAPDALARIVADTYRLEVARFETAQPTATKLLTGGIARKFGVFPLRDEDRYLVVATADPTDLAAEQEIGFASGRTPRLVIAPPEEISRAIDAGYSPDAAAESLLARAGDQVSEVEFVEEEAEVERLSVAQTSTGPVVRLTNLVISDAIAKGVSDIHIQPTPTGGVVRYRIDGVLQTGLQMPIPVLTRVVSRIKVMSRLDIADRLRPQDGRAQVKIDDRTYDLRVSTVPTRNAEKAVIRILDPEASGTLDETGIAEGERERIRKALSSRDGIFVVTGPTGSGKTTTMYASLREISTADVNIMTVEDPVEYELSGLTQIQVEPKQGVTFASALRAILRQDPDVIFVGEIRDGETAEIAAQASLTGHLVLATLHTNDAVGAVRRFLDLGLDAATISETLRAALAQRLVRTACPHCSTAVEEPLTAAEQELADRYRMRPTVRPVGCPRCSNLGYLGRMPVTEFMTVTPELARLIVDGAPSPDLEAQAARDGMRTLLQSALDLVAVGTTTLEEVERVIGDETSAGDAPQTRTPSPTTNEEEPAHPPVDAEDHQVQVLVVDDDATNRGIARALLEKSGYDVTDVEDGSLALALLAKGRHFDAMVLDLDMPLLGGRDVLKAVRASVSTAGLPVVVLTGSGVDGTEVELLKQGADDYLDKPLDPARFVARVDAVLRRAAG